MKKLLLILMVSSLFMGCAVQQAFEDSKNISETDLLNKVNDPIGEEAFAFTVLYSTAIVVLKRI